MQTEIMANDRPGETVTVAIMQSNYLPWQGYFDLMNRADRFVLYDEVQYTKNDWRNRNRIKTKSGPLWISIPVRSSGRFRQPICAVEVADRRWADKHWRTIREAYSRAAYFAEYEDIFAHAYERARHLARLSDINRLFLDVVRQILGISTPLVESVDLPGPPGQTRRLVGICERLGATEYLSGPAARAYLDESQFRAAGIRVRYMDYSDYPPSPQLHGPYVPKLSMIDLIFNTGPAARNFSQPAPSPAGVNSGA